MRGTAWIDWTRTKLQPHEREDLLTALTSEQKEQLLERDYVWVKGIGVLWKPPDGALRRARFTHGTHFQTQRGRFALGPSPGIRIYPFGLGLVPNTRCLARMAGWCAGGFGAPPAAGGVASRAGRLGRPLLPRQLPRRPWSAENSRRAGVVDEQRPALG